LLPSCEGDHRCHRSVLRGCPRQPRVFSEQAAPGWLRQSTQMWKRRTAALVVLLALSSPAFANDLIGQASIIDGNTLEIHGTRIRLWGIDAPESSQLCRGEDSSRYQRGAQAANDLDAFIARRPVKLCARQSRPVWADGRDMCGRRRRSWRVACPQWICAGLAAVSKGKYSAAQHDAERAGRGIWKGSYVEPWLYRACIRANGNPANCSDDANARP
jgi:endonuclease YncB( thermonuclease family)